MVCGVGHGDQAQLRGQLAPGERAEPGPAARKAAAAGLPGGAAPAFAVTSRPNVRCLAAGNAASNRSSQRDISSGPAGGLASSRKFPHQ